jgi:tetratricopeptide (TPR) repeat protein
LLEAVRNEAARHYGSDAAEARRIAARAVVLAVRTGDLLALGWAHRAVAESLLFSGRMREAEAAYAKAAEAWKKAGAGALLGQLLVGRIHVLSLLGRMGQVETTARKARQRLEAAGDSAYLAKLAMNLGNLHFQRDEYAGALAEYDRARKLFACLGVRDQTVLGLEVNRAVALTQLDRDTEAMDLFHRLERDCGRRKLDLLQAQVRMNAAAVHSLRGDFDLALGELGRATDYFRETGHPVFLASCLANRAEIYHQLNLHEDALRLAEESAELFGADGLVYDRALALSQGALSRLARGDTEGAVSVIREALHLFTREKNPARVALARMLWAEASSRRGRRADARRRAHEAMEAFQALGLVRWEAMAAALWVRLSGRDLSASLRQRALRELLARVPGRIYPVQVQALLEILGEAQEDAGDAPRAARTYARAVEMLESMRIRVPTEDSKVAFLRDKTHLYDRLVALELVRPAPVVKRLLGWMERSRSQSLWDQMRDPSRWSGGTDGVADEERRRLSWLQARVSRLELGTPEERERAVSLRRALIRAEQDWARSLRAQGETAAGPRRGAERRAGPRDRTSATRGGDQGGDTVPDPATIRRALPEGHGFLSYHLAPRFAVVAWVTQDGEGWLQLGDGLSSKLTDLADRLDFQWSAAAMAMTGARRTMTMVAPAVAPLIAPAVAPEIAPLVAPAVASAGAAGVAPRIVRASRTTGVGRADPLLLLQNSAESILSEMHALVWRPLVETGLREDLLWIVSPHGAMHRLPFPALLGADGPLVEKTSVRVVPSARIWLALQKRRLRAARRVYVAGVPSVELPAVEREVALVGKHLSSWEVVTDLAPTRETLRREGARAGLIHLAAHGSLRKDNPAFSSIQLADGPLLVHDLAGFRLSGSTVVLTACSSGRGAAPSGDEWIGLARGFLQAGASAVVASLWPIEDEATLELMDLFYGGVAAGQDAAEALRRAMMELRGSRPHPWHWASLAVLGGGRGIRKQERGIRDQRVS